MAVFDNGIKATELGHSGTGEAGMLLVGSGSARASMLVSNELHRLRIRTGH